MPRPRRLLLVGLLAAALTAWLRPGDRSRWAQYPAGTTITAADGRMLRRLLGPGDVDCRPVAAVTPESWIARAVVAVEDRRFWDHAGVDPLAMLRATWQNLRGGHVVSGASTVSSLVIRLTTPRPRTLRTKLVEFTAAVRLERTLTKTEILTQYLNRAPFGGNVIGIQAASRRYFNKDWNDLSLAEAALLAGLPQAPSHLRPDRHPRRAERRQRHVLSRMLACGTITRDARSALAASG